MSVTFSVSPDGVPPSTSTIISTLKLKSPHKGPLASAVILETRFKALLEIAGYEFFDYYLPANGTFSDYFDHLVLPGNRLAVVVADISAKVD